MFDCDRRVVQVRKDTGEKRTFQFDSLLEPGI
jgi:predicted ATPase